MSEKNKTNKIKDLNNGKLIKEADALYINNPDYLLCFSDLKVSDGIDIIENIMILSNNYINSNRKYKTDEISDEELMEITEEYKDLRNIEGGYISENFDDLDYIINSYDDIKIISIISNDFGLQDFSNELKVINSEKGFIEGKLNIGQIILIDKALSPKLLIQIYKIAIKQKAKFFQSLHLPLHINNITNNNDFLVVASNLPEESLNEDYVMDVGLDITNMDWEDEKFELNEFKIRIEDAVTISCEDAVKKIDLSVGILDYFVAEGILIGDLIEAGLELVDKEKITDDLNNELEDEILKSITNINISFLLMAAIQIREGLDENRLREINLKENYKDIYNDDIFGIAIANEIAGTKAIIKYKDYIELKPGIIYGLNPILDKAFAGLIAACVTKVLEK